MRDPWPYLEAIQRVIQGAGTRSAGQNEEQVTSKVVRDLRKMSNAALFGGCLLYTSPSPRDRQKSRMPSSA